MSRVAVVGVGEPWFLESRNHSGPGLRAGQICEALQRAGHEVLLVLANEPNGWDEGFVIVRRGQAVPRATGRIEVLHVNERAFGSDDLRQEWDRFAPNCVVGAGAYAAALAGQLQLDLPFWADIFGDLMAEGQAKAAAQKSDATLVHFWSLLGPVLDRADKFSAVSSAQRLALVGQLGLAGRLGHATAGYEFVEVMRCAVPPRRDETRPSTTDAQALREKYGIPERAFVVLWSGSFNTWCDIDTVLDGLDTAMGRRPDFHAVMTGGPVVGHDETTYEHFVNRLGRLEHARRIHFLGRVDNDELDGVYAISDLALHAERSLYERELGAENRALHWLGAGVPMISTGLSEFATRLVDEGLAFRFPVGDPEAMADTLLERLAKPERLRALRPKCRDFASMHCTPEQTCQPLVAWCNAPAVAPDHGAERSLDLGLFSDTDSLARMLDAYLSRLPLAEVARRGGRWLCARLLRTLKRRADLG